jgi:hypothetical protein
MSARKPRTHAGKRRGRGLIAKLRKPMAPPTRIAEDDKKYSRARERERLRRERARNGAK